MPKPDLDALVRRFCLALAADTGGRPMQWRSAVSIARRCRISDDKLAGEIVRHAVQLGWLEQEDGHSVALTDAGRRLR